MLSRNEWSSIHRRTVFSKGSQNIGVTVTIFRDDATNERVWAFRPTQHTILVYLGEFSDPMEAQIDGGPFIAGPATPGLIWLVPAGSRYHGHVRGQAPTICEITLQEMTMGGNTCHMSPLFNTHDGLLHQAALRFVELAAAQSEVARLLLDCLAATVRWHIFETYGSLQALPKPQSDQPLGGRAKTLLESYIRDHLADRITLDELAGIAGLSTHNLLKRFRASFGTTPAQYIINERVAKARLLLEQSPLPITDVALATGFYSPSHFSTVFSKHVGITPTFYRRRP